MFTFAGMACAAGAIIGVAIAYSYIGRRATKALSKDVSRMRHWQVRISDKGLAMRNGDSRIQHAWGAVDQVLLADEMVILRFSGGIFPLTARTLPDDVSINDAKARIDEWRAE
jgi:hypothetical protein